MSTYHRTPAMPQGLRDLALAAKGFLPPAEGDLLYRVAVERLGHGPALEVGSYCGKSGIYLGAGACTVGGTVFTVDHHRGSEENQAGWKYHDPTLVDQEIGQLDTLPTFRRTIAKAGLENHIVAVVGRSATVSTHWRTPLSLLFIDGGHTDKHAGNDYVGWARWLANGATMMIHDVFPDPSEGGQPPYRIYLRALESGDFVETADLGSMRVLTRIGGDAGDPVR